MDELMEKGRVFFAHNPEYIYLIIGVVFLVLFIGVVKNKSWAIDPSSTQQRQAYQDYGHLAFRKYIGAIYCLAAIAGFSGYFLQAG